MMSENSDNPKGRRKKHRALTSTEGIELRQERLRRRRAFPLPSILSRLYRVVISMA
jgi:hypothetical protein